MLATSTLPASPMIAQQLGEARQIARKAAEALGYVGVMTLEFFATAEGPVFNAMAPRVHNSGHWTIEGAATRQLDRKSAVSGKSVSVRVDLGGSRNITKK